MKLTHVLAAIATACLLAATPALAQTTTIDGASIFGAWRPYITEIVGMIITAGLGWLFVVIKSKLGLDIEARHREALQTALTNAAGLVIAKAGSAADAIKIDVKNPAIAEAVTYVLKGAPDALAYFGLTPEKLREKVLAKVGVVASADTGAAPVALLSTGGVGSGPLRA